MANTPFWNWCPSPGMSRDSKMTVEQNAFGDGYVHRATRGLNPVRPSWSQSFPFVGEAELQAMTAFLEANSAAGFWCKPPGEAADVFVVADEWSAQMSERNIARGVVGNINVTFVRIFNPQPISP